MWHLLVPRDSVVLCLGGGDSTDGASTMSVVVTQTLTWLTVLVVANVKCDCLSLSTTSTTSNQSSLILTPSMTFWQWTELWFPCSHWNRPNFVPNIPVKIKDSFKFETHLLIICFKIKRLKKNLVLTQLTDNKQLNSSFDIVCFYHCVIWYISFEFDKMFTAHFYKEDI